MTRPRPQTSEMHREVEELVYRYCDLIDRARIDDVVELFTTNGEVDYGHGRRICGADELRAFFTDRLRSYNATSHHSSNVVVGWSERSADHLIANVSSSIYAWHQRADGSQIEIWGRYFDVVVGDSDGWRIRSRAIRAAGWRGFTVPDGDQEPFEMIDRQAVK